MIELSLLEIRIKGVSVYKPRVGLKTPVIIMHFNFH